MFYKELHEKRKELGLTIEQVSQKTKISQDILEKIEKGEFSSLPDLYIRLFIKSYAFELGFDPEEYLKKYEAEYGSKKHDVKQNIIENNDKETVNENLPISHLNDRNKLIAFVSIVAILIFVIVILKQVLSENEQPTVSPIHQQLMEQNTTENEVKAEDATTDIETPQQVAPAPATTIVESNEEDLIETTVAVLDSSTMFDLKMEINDTCWVKIVIDERDTSEAIFKPGYSRSWKAFNIIDLRVGRPEVVNLYINDVEVDSIDISKAPARMIITKNGITNR